MKAYTGTETLESMSQAGFYNKWALSKFNEYLKGEILEIGCGIGNFTRTLGEYGSVSAIDIDKTLIKKFSNDTIKIKAGYGDIEKDEYFFGKKFFDTIVCINVLEHIQNDTKALKNMYSLLKKGGTLILLVPIHNFLFGEIDKSVGHFRRYDPKVLLEIVRNSGYRIILNKKLNFLGAIGWFIAGRVLRNNGVTQNKIKLFNIISPLLYLEDIIEPPVGTSVLIIAKK